jgi:hypothetical protein
MTLASGSPSPVPTSTSERMPRMVRVIGAQVTEDRTSIAASRVSTQIGRRPARGPRSAQKMSPLVTTPEPSLRQAFRRPEPDRDPGESADRRLEDRDLPAADPRHPKRPAHLDGAARIDWFPAPRPSDRVEKRDRRLAERELRVVAWPYDNTYGPIGSGVHSAATRRARFTTTRGEEGLRRLQRPNPAGVG